MKWLFYVFFCSAEHCHCSQPPRAILSLFTASSCHQCSLCTHCLLLYLLNIANSVSVSAVISVSECPNIASECELRIYYLSSMTYVRTLSVPIATCFNLITWRWNSYQKKKTSFIVNNLLWFATNSELFVLLQRYPLFSHWSILLFFTSFRFFEFFLQFSYSWKQCSASVVCSSAACHHLYCPSFCNRYLSCNCSESEFLLLLYEKRIVFVKTDLYEEES